MHANAVSINVLGFPILHAPENLQPNVFGPTRPPSRNDRETIDLTREHAAGAKEQNNAL
jgi:hypothetical protein